MSDPRAGTVTRPSPARSSDARSSPAADALPGRSTERVDPRIKKFEAAQKRLAGTARKTRGSVPSGKAEELWTHGFLPDKQILYDFPRHGFGAYLSDIQREMTRVINGPYATVLNSKVAFNTTFSPVISTPAIVAFTNGRNFIGGPLKDGLDFFAKPASGGAGTGVFRGRVEGARVKLANRTSSREEFEADILSREIDYLITETVVAHPQIKTFFAGTTNTIRVLMMRDPESGEGFIAAAVLRVGSAATGDLDNYSRGGVSCPVDIATGLVGVGRLKTGGQATEHPDTGDPITGRTIPMWEMVVQVCHRAFDHCPGLQYVGWDVIVAENGPVILEGNNYSDVHLLQTHRPLLLDKRVRSFYRFHGMLDFAPTTAFTAA